jgi:hypothetical protein
VKHFFCLALVGCAAAPTFPEPDSTWVTASGQLRYVTGDRSAIGEFVVSKRANDLRLDFVKGGAVPLIRVDRHGMEAQAEGPLARGRWRGNVAGAPPHVRSWVNEVFAAFGGMESIQDSLRKVSSDNDRALPRQIEVQGANPGERFVFIFNR